jgi:hypothetical protein
MSQNADQIIHELRREVAMLQDHVSILKRDVAEESKAKYAAYQRIEELNHLLSKSDKNLSR